jgi:hypothetical protein
LLRIPRKPVRAEVVVTARRYPFLRRSSGDDCHNLFAGAPVCCEPHLMSPSPVEPPYDRFLTTAETVAAARPEVDLEMAREVFLEVATVLYNGLALDGLDEHDTEAVVDALCIDLVAEDPGAAVRARSAAALQDPGNLHDPEAVSASYLIAAAMMQL